MVAATRVMETKYALSALAVLLYGAQNSDIAISQE